MTDFKSNKLYWEFQSAFIKIKSCQSDEFLPNTFLYEELEYEYPVEIGNLLNTFFTRLSSTSLSSEKDCDEYIDTIFARLKSENKIRIKTERFKFCSYELENCRKAHSQSKFNWWSRFL